MPSVCLRPIQDIPKIRNPETGIRHPKIKQNKALQEHKNEVVHFLHAKVERSIKNGFKAQLLKKGSPVSQFNVRATVIPCEGRGYANLEYRTA